MKPVEWRPGSASMRRSSRLPGVLRSGATHSFRGRFLELSEGRRLRYTDAFDDPGLPGDMAETLDLAESGTGTDLRIVQAGIPDAIPVDACYQGWQESLELLAKLVEPGIPDGA